MIALSGETGWKSLAAKLLKQFKERITKNSYREDSEYPGLFFGKKMKDTGEIQENLVLLNWPDRSVESLEVVELMNRDKIRPVNLSRFLYLGQENTEFIEVAQKFTIITFGSFWKLNETIFVPAFYNGSLEHPDLLWLFELWGSNCYFVGLTS